MYAYRSFDSLFRLVIVLILVASLVAAVDPGASESKTESPDPMEKPAEKKEEIKETTTSNTLNVVEPLNDTDLEPISILDEHGLPRGAVTDDGEDGMDGPTLIPMVERKPEIPLHTLEELKNIPGPWACASLVYCQGPLLDAVQRNRLFPDSKTFVDMTLKEDPEKVVEAFDELLKEKENITRADLAKFLEAHFDTTGHELEKWTPPDWTDTPALVNRIKDEDYRDWAVNINGLWKTLGRRVKGDVYRHPDRFSIIPVPNGFIIPGDRFREFYYWDNYWIINGLLLSDMVNTTKGILENLLHVVDQYGFVPNGGRKYYTQRSQPPVLSLMVDAYYEASKDAEFVKDNYFLLVKEYNFWLRERTVTVEKDGEIHNLAVYTVNLTHPRPEGYLEDLEVVRGMFLNESARKFSMLAAGAETGWDFSTRWFKWSGEDKDKIRSIKTADIVPVDLNVFLYYTEKILGKLAKVAGHDNRVSTYESKAELRLADIEAVLWNEEDGIWYDYDMVEETHRKRFYLSNIAPLLIYSEHEDKVQKVVDYLKREEVMDYPGGLPTSKIKSGQQWDLPNTWAPIVYLATTALGNSNLTEAQELAYKISTDWLETSYTSWKATGQMYEKYKATKKGEAGKGGEYTVQAGFGWTNGYILQLLNRYSDVLVAPEVDTVHIKSWRPHSGDQKLMFILIPVAVFITAVLFFICVMKRSTKKRGKKGAASKGALSSSNFQKIS